MATSLRIDTFKWLSIEQKYLSPLLGCGLVLKRIPKLHTSDVFEKVMSGYKASKIYADKPAQKVMQTEKLIKYFCQSALSGVPLNENFRNVFAPYNLILLIDINEESAWFIGDVENRLALVNYYRDVVPNILKAFGIIVTGSVVRLMPVGWQNLYDVIDENLVKSYPDIKSVEILSLITDARYRSHVLSIGINLLNLTSPEVIREKILNAIKSV
jgi:hypothetical protein